MANNTSCSAGKTIVVDPNKFDGQSSSTNISVPLEDLSISVQLTTKKKARTVLTSDGVNSSTSSKGVSVTFIEGSEINGEKVLTTKYTDLTTDLNDSSETENLGITNIEIDFNSSYAPLISITFIDLRGSAIFQNESNISDGKNKYATFFQLPYPVYDLTIKGYYGLPVKYTLHMTKFNAKFNSQTGNFEITANFVGYTYAMLSDMLIGYLRAIPYTRIGANLYNELKNPELGGDPNLLTLDELMVNISKIGDETKKLQASDKDFADVSKGQAKLDILDIIETNIFTLGNELNMVSPNNIEITKYPIIIIDKTKDEIKIKDNYVKQITENILNFNDDNLIDLQLSDFIGTSLKKYSGLTLDLLKPTNSGDDVNINRLKEIFNLSDITEINKTREDIFRYAKTYVITSEFEVYDLRELYKKITLVRVDIKDAIIELNNLVAKKLRLTIREKLKVDPTIRNIVSVFTSAVEVLMKSIYQVSVSAIGEHSEIRRNELEKWGPEKKGNSDSYDIPNKSNESTNNDGPLVPIYYPWPDYRVNDDITGLKEAYLGELGVLDDPENVDEILFIEDLFNAFMKSASKKDENDITLITKETNWIPSNPLDTRLFNDVFPYKRNQLNSKKDVINLMLIRLFTYVGFSNKNLKIEEVIKFAEIEANSVLRDVVNPTVLKTLSNLKPEDFITSEGFIDNGNIPIMKKLDENYYYYNYIFGISKTRPFISPIPSESVNWDTVSDGDARRLHLLPISIDPLDKNYVNIPSNGSETYVNISKNSAENGNIFLSNYTTTPFKNNGIIIKKPIDGATYIKIIPKDLYNGDTVKSIPEKNSDESILSFEELSKEDNNFNINSVGFNQFGGNYGIQEFRYISYNNDVENLEKAPYMTLFYEKSFNEGKYIAEFLNVTITRSPFNLGGGLARKRKIITQYDFNNADNSTFTSAFSDIHPQNSLIIKSFDIYIQQIYGEESLHAEAGFNRSLLSEYLTIGSNDIVYPYINFWVKDEAVTDPFEPALNLAPVSLFGSRFYYHQKSEYAKAFLFLHTFPWNGLLFNGEGVFTKNEILNSFAQRAGFICTPKLWVAFIGGLLWRADNSDQKYIDGTDIQYGGGSGLNDPITWLSDLNEPLIPKNEIDTVVPNREQYLVPVFDLDFPISSAPMTFINDSFVDSEYKNLETMLLQLPDQVKEEFKIAFFEFVKTNSGESDWDRMRNNLQVFNGTGNEWDISWNNLVANNGIDITNKSTTKNKLLVEYDAEINGKKVLDNYVIFSPYIGAEDYNYNFALELKDDCEANKLLVSLFADEVVIGNMSPKIWDINGISGDIGKYEGIFITQDELSKYLDTVIKTLKPTDGSSINDIEKQRKSEIFGSENDDIIKLQLYRTCKNIYDKWIGGTDNIEKLIFDEDRNGLDIELAKNARGINATPNLIDSFRFVTRSFRDIGNEMVINPTPVYDYLHDNINSSFYDSVTNLLSSNNFDFIALPNYINYGDTTTIESLFKPMSANEAFKKGTTGPSFVCVYVGQKSKNLDFRDSEYTNDGVDFICDSDGNLLPTAAKDFYNNNEIYENKVPVFAVNYSQQNQNIFKDIILDQSEFSETAESLQITSDIGDKDGKVTSTFGGQNIYNVYSVRSYKTEVEMMGNAMIQPMMYFQLNNIPMFHGAYMITHVKHSIKPNSMSTHFTGVRIRNVETPIIDSNDLFISILDSIDGVSINSGREFASPNFDQDIIPDPSLSNLFSNPYQLGVNEKSTINSAPGIRSFDGSVRNHEGVDFGTNQQEGINLLAIAKGNIELVKYNFNSDKKTGYGLYIVINHGPLGTENKIYKSVYAHLSSLDFKILGKNISELTPNEINQLISVGLTPNTSVEKGQVIGKSGGITGKNYLKQSEKKYDLAGGSSGAHLHFELRVGLEDLPFKNMKYVNPVPYLPLASTAIYKNGNIPKQLNNNVTTVLGDNADYWSLVAICAKESLTSQGRADVAQSIYNRNAMPDKGYGSSIKDIIVKKNQYEPVFNNLNDWKLINDQATAIIALKNSFSVGKSKWTEEQAKSALKSSSIAINNTTLQKNAIDFIGTRTSFRAEIKDVKKGVTDTVERTPSAENNIFFWEDGGIQMKGKPVPKPIDFVSKKVNINVI